jgi:hypothetical protein
MLSALHCQSVLVDECSDVKVGIGSRADNFLKNVIDICPLLDMIELKATYAGNYEEMNDMPRRDGTGPLGAGSMAERRSGPCRGADARKHRAGHGRGLGLGHACRRGLGHGFGRGAAADQNSSKTQKELLQEQKNVLKRRLDAIDEQLENS